VNVKVEFADLGVANEIVDVPRENRVLGLKTF
jgi:hypothetical protein